MKKIKILSTTLVLAFVGASALVFTSCEEEASNDSQSSRPITAINDGDLSDSEILPQYGDRKVAVIGNLTGRIGSGLKEVNLETYPVDLQSINLMPNTGTLLIDVDAYNDQNKNLIWKSYDMAFQQELAIVIESGSNNDAALVQFFKTELGGLVEDGDINALFTQRVGKIKRTTPVGDKYGYQTYNLLNDYFSPTHNDVFLKRLLGDEEKSTVSMEDSIDTTNEFVQKASYTYNNISIDDAIRRVKGSFQNSELSGSITWTAAPTARPIRDSGITHSNIIWSGSLQDARGKCAGQQSGSISETVSVSKTFNVNLSLGPKVPISAERKGLGEIAGAAGFGYSSSKVSGRVNTSSLSLYTEYARAHVYRDTKYVHGRYEGSVTFNVRCWSSAGGRVRQQIHNVRINFTNSSSNTQNLWNGHKPPTSSVNRFAWDEWGSRLPSCRR